jgi:Amidohydrolase family
MLLHGGRVLRLGAAQFEQADILVEGDRIVEVAPRLAHGGDEETIDARPFLVLPGLINAHAHGHGHLLRGRAGRWTLEDLLNHGAALNGNRTPEEHYLSAALGALEMLKSGCTAAYDLFMAVPALAPEMAEAIARAYLDVGLRAVIAPAAADLVFHETVPGLAGLLPWRAHPDEGSASGASGPSSGEAVAPLRPDGERFMVTTKVRWVRMGRAVLVSGLLLGACATAARDRAAEIEPLLIAAGFQKRVADTPQKLAHLQQIPPPHADPPRAQDVGLLRLRRSQRLSLRLRGERDGVRAVPGARPEADHLGVQGLGHAGRRGLDAELGELGTVILAVTA